MGIMGIMVFIGFHIKDAINKKWLYVLFFLFLISVVAIFTNIINNTMEMIFVTYSASRLMIIASAYFLAVILRMNYKKITFVLIAKYISICVTIQMLIAIAMVIVPSFRSILNILTDELRSTNTMISSEGLFRLIGFGSHSFSSGIVNGFALLIVTILMKEKGKASLEYFFLTVGFLLISTIGNMMSRSTVVGIFLSIFLFLISFKSKFKYFIIFAKYVFFLLFLVIILVVQMPKVAKSKLISYFEYGFELFVNYLNKGELSTKSSDETMNMFDTFPSNMKTWIIGDGYFAHPTNPAKYYMNTDVGHARLLFYFGIIGSFCFFIYQFSLVYFANNQTGGNYSQFFAMIILLLLVLNIKGFTDFTPFLSIFLFCK
jgi:hypothetical protein